MHFLDFMPHAAQFDLGSNAGLWMGAIEKKCENLFYPGSLVILPEDGRRVYFEAFAAARKGNSDRNLRPGRSIYFAEPAGSIGAWHSCPGYRRQWQV